MAPCVARRCAIGLRRFRSAKLAEGRVAETTMRAAPTTRWDWAPAWLKRPYRSLVPGLIFTAAVGIAALLLGALEKALFTYDVIEPLVLALVIGMLIRTVA